MIEQDWVHGFIGGLMIGGAAALYLLVNGRIMGASGILGGLLDGTERGPWAERLSFLAALILVPVLIVPLYTVVDTHLTQNWRVIVAGGLLTGIGTRLANGCTSGHGICGMASLQPQSLLAVLTFLGTAFITANLVKFMGGQ